MAKKKAVGNGAGTVYPRRNKEGKIIGYLGSYFDQAGKRRYVSAKQKNACRTKLRKVMSDADQGIIFDAKGLMVEAFLERWLEDVVRPNNTHRTYATHRQQILGHIVPALGRIKLDALRKAHIDRLYASLLAERPAGSGLAPSSVRRLHAVLHAALEEAVRGDLIPRNPATHANKPKVRQQDQEGEPLGADQARKLLAAAGRGPDGQPDRYEALYALCLQCALRQGEALALRWSDIDLEAGTVYIERQLQRVRRDGEKSGKLVFSEPKNASRRKVGLPRRTVEALQRHAERQAGEIEAAGEAYQDQDLVFANGTGGPLDAQNVVNRHFKPLLKRAGLPPIRFHDLRHSCLSLLAQEGEPIRNLQALAGHASAAFTLQRYVHHYGTSASRTARTMDEVLK